MNNMGWTDDQVKTILASDKIKQSTNADRIRAMSDDELAELLLDGCRGSNCDAQPQNEFGSVDCLKCRLNWLKQPADK